MPRIILGLLLAAALGGCATTSLNYPDAAGPRYGMPAPVPAQPAETLRVVAFNLKYASHPDRAIVLLREDGPLHDADVLLLQEMDEAATRAIAEALNLGYVFYPATRHPRTGRDFGNAVLSRFPIEEDRKVVLPHFARIRRTIRAAVGATLVVGPHRVRVYSVHLDTFIGNGPRARREQLAEILADADAYPVVVLGGDFNSETVPEIALDRGYVWPTRHLPRTELFWTFDHILVKGLTLGAAPAFGLVREIHGASDHKPVWARVVLPEERTAQTP